MKNKKSKIQIDEPKDRSGHYSYQSKGKSLFENRPKRLRTRKAILDAELEEFYDDGFEDYDER